MSYALKLGIQPGITAFITDVVSVEVGTSVLGLSSEYTRTTTNGVEEDEGYTWSNEVSFEIDLAQSLFGHNFLFSHEMRVPVPKSIVLLIVFLMFGCVSEDYFGRVGPI